MALTIALVGNPNAGKTTLFNQLTGNRQYVGNWPGVTVERKTGTLRDADDVAVVDLPGIYSLTPYSNEEIVARDYLERREADVILDIVDASNLERNLYLTTQLMEFGTPVVVALNQMDIVRKRGYEIDSDALGRALGLPVIEISALRGEGIADVVAAVRKAAEDGIPPVPCAFSPDLEALIEHLEGDLPESVEPQVKRFHCIKYLERDERILAEHGPIHDLDEHVRAVEARFGDAADAVIANARYDYIAGFIGKVQKKAASEMSATEKIDRVLLNRVLAIPIFAVIIVAIYWISISTVGAVATDWANDGVFGDGWFLDPIAIVDPDAGAQAAYDEAVAELVEQAGGDPDDEFADPGELGVEAPDPAGFGIWVPGIPVIVGGFLESVDCADWLYDLIIDGIIAGVGAVLGFVPQIMILFFLLVFLEGCGYMARVTFILDRVFRRFGLSGKTFIPMIVGTGCGVPGIMASRTIESESSRHLTVMTTTFMPCSAKLPIIGLISAAVFGGAWWVAPCAYFMGIASIVISGIILKKTRPFRGEATPYIMELPEYRLPRFVDLLRSMWQRAWSFIKKAGTIILLATVVVWFLSGYGVYGGRFMWVGDDLADYSLLAYFGNAIAWVFMPLGFGNWQAASTVVTGLIAKENVIGTLAVVFGGGSSWQGAFLDSLALTAGGVAAVPFAAFSFMAFQLLCAPCFAAMGAIKGEMGGFNRWFWAALGWECGWAYAVALIVFQLGSFAAGGAFGTGTAVAIALLALILLGLFRPAPKDAGEARA